jgi:hypothetical protein
MGRMSRKLLRASLFVGGLAAVAALPVVAQKARGGEGPRCELDGAAVDGSTRARIVDDQTRTHVFCCIDCARKWLAASRRTPLEFTVLDETTGAEMAADQAWFVRSPVVSCAASGSHLHAFALESDARRHVTAFGGLVLSRDERPFVRRD